MTIRPLLLCFVLLVGCSFAPATQPVAAVALTGHPPARLDDAQVQALFHATNRQVVAVGFQGNDDRRDSVGYTLTLEPIYGAGFLWGNDFGCTSHFSRREALVRFYEYSRFQSPDQSAARERQRCAIRALAARIEASLRRSVPAGFEVRVGVDFPQR